MVVGQQYHIGEKPTVMLYTYINRHAGTPDKTTELYPKLPVYSVFGFFPPLNRGMLRRSRCVLCFFLKIPLHDN